ncbi:MAG: zf-HC2 domain-containing protein [Pyrinomonadaceae bacterium]|nr:zf-HC2 domain-containing protein [Pyrinomonadaceae bacterium]
MTKKEMENQSHQEIQHLLPWYVNETLSAAERERVAAHLSDCSSCLAELESMQVLRSVVRDSNERLAPSSEGQLDALIARIEKSEADNSRQKNRALGARLTEWWASLPAFAKATMLAQAVAVIVLAGVSVTLLRKAERREAEAIQERQRAELNESLLANEKQRALEYQAFSGGPTDSGGAGLKITVVFREDVKEKEIRSLLLSIKATIVSGPSSARFYVIRLAVPPDADAQSLMNDALARLHRRSDLVQLAEPLP